MTKDKRNYKKDSEEAVKQILQREINKIRSDLRDKSYKIESMAREQKILKKTLHELFELRNKLNPTKSK